MTRRRANRLVCLLALGLAGCGGEAPMDPGIDVAAKSPAPELASIFHGQELEHWIRVARSPLASERAEAAWGLGELGAGKAEAERALRPLVLDWDAGVRLAFFVAVQRWGFVPEGWSGLVLAGSLDPVEPIARLAGTLAEDLSADALVGALTAPEATPAMGQAIKRRLARKGAAAVPTLRRLLQGSDVAHQHLAAEAVGAIGARAEAAVPELLHLLTAKAPLGPAAATALGRVGPAAKAPLEQFLASGEAQGTAKLLARMALSRIGK